MTLYPPHRFDPSKPAMDPAGPFRRHTLEPHQLGTRLTPADDLFVIAHLGVPRVDPTEWTLTIDGLTETPMSLTLDELKVRSRITVEAVHECCGSPMEPTVPTRRASNVRWGGVDLAALLDEIGIDRRARYLWSFGLDSGRFADIAAGWYAKDLPLGRLDAGGVLIAYELNGEPLTAEHGFPLRLVVPGYYGTNSVKWLWRLHLSASRYDGPFTTRYYTDRLSPDDPGRPVWAFAPESAIVAPAPGAVLPADRLVEIWGWTWSWDGIAGVEVSTDGGASYSAAWLETREGWAWQRFSAPWRPERSGKAVISARATGADGTSQPVHGARNAVHTVEVMVEGP